VTAVFLLVAFAVFFKVRTINITGNSRYSYDDINAVLPVKLDENLYSSGRRCGVD
jgi:cell division septal protein FtsQ